MAESSGRWEADPLFSAAEVVQDSADRMESIYRLLLHEETLFQGDNSDSKLLASMQFHRRDLVTTLETTKWQLEDFEKAVQVSFSSDQFSLKKKSISSFKQFIEAIREQILQVEKILENLPSEDLEMQMMKLNDHEVDGLALFLYGGHDNGHHIKHDLASNLARRDIDTSVHSDEIVEVESKDLENVLAKKTKCATHSETNVGSRYSRALVFGCQSSDFHHVYLGETEDEMPTINPQQNDLEAGACNTKCFSARSNLSVPVVGYLRTFWLSSTNKLTRSFTKRRKDGDASYYLTESGWSQSSPSVSPAQFFARINASWRSLNNIQFTLLSVRIHVATLIAVMLVTLGFLAFRV